MCNPVYWEYKMLRNSYRVMIGNMRKAHQVDFLQSLDKKSIWMAHKYASGKPLYGGKAQVPALEAKEENGMMREVISCEEKSKLFEKTFFLGMDHMVPTHETAI